MSEHSSHGRCSGEEVASVCFGGIWESWSSVSSPPPPTLGVCGSWSAREHLENYRVARRSRFSDPIVGNSDQHPNGGSLGPTRLNGLGIGPTSAASLSDGNGRTLQDTGHTENPEFGRTETKFGRPGLVEAASPGSVARIRSTRARPWRGQEWQRRTQATHPKDAEKLLGTGS